MHGGSIQSGVHGRSPTALPASPSLTPPTHAAGVRAHISQQLNWNGWDGGLACHYSCGLALTLSPPPETVLVLLFISRFPAQILSSWASFWSSATPMQVSRKGQDKGFDHWLADVLVGYLAVYCLAWFQAFAATLLCNKCLGIVQLPTDQIYI